MLIDALHAPFEDREETFATVYVSFAANVFLTLVVHGFMSGHRATDRFVPCRLICHETRFARDICRNYFANGLCVDVRQHLATGLALLTINEGDNLHLEVSAVLLLTL